MLQDVFAAIPLGIVLAFLFGPVFFVLLETAAIKGIRAAIVFDIGVILADLAFLLIAYFSTSRLLESIKDEPGLFIFGGTILITYGIITFIKEKKIIPLPKDQDVRKIKRGDWLGYIAKGFLLNFVNIGVLGFWLGLIIAFGPTMDMQPNRIVVFFAAILVTYFIVDLLKIILAKKLNHRLTPNLIYKFKRTISVIIALCGVVLMTRGMFPHKMEQMQEKVETVFPEVSQLSDFKPIGRK
ncbi:MAG TPA: LysE family transporter [Flavobacteriaceae bacterium]|nr:LysE family transporter [Flavobacteriaceae bacterium]